MQRVCLYSRKEYGSAAVWFSAKQVNAQRGIEACCSKHAEALDHTEIFGRDDFYAHCANKHHGQCDSGANKTAAVYERKLTTPSSPSFCIKDFFMLFLLKKTQCETAEIAVSTASLRLADLRSLFENSAR